VGPFRRRQLAAVDRLTFGQLLAQPLQRDTDGLAAGQQVLGDDLADAVVAADTMLRAAARSASANRPSWAIIECTR
jgi:hypothetical protein